MPDVTDGYVVTADSSDPSGVVWAPGGGTPAASVVTVDSTTLVGTGTDVQAVLEELDNGIADHLADTVDAHDATAISFAPAGTIAATTVQAAIEEVATEAGGGGVDWEDVGGAGGGAGGVEVKDAGSTVGTRSAINLIEGANVTLTITDDPGNDEVDITIASTGGGGGGTGYMILVPLMETIIDSPKWANSGTPVVRWLFIIPPDWDGASDFTVKVMRRSSASGGTSIMPRSTFRFRDATASNTVESNVAMSFTPGDTNTHLTTFTLAAANFAIGDTVRIDLARSSADVGDTNTGSVDSDGGWVEYDKA